jgi:hypothetical protein
MKAAKKQWLMPEATEIEVNSGANAAVTESALANTKPGIGGS